MFLLELFIEILEDAITGFANGVAKIAEKRWFQVTFLSILILFVAWWMWSGLSLREFVSPEHFQEVLSPPEQTTEPAGQEDNGGEGNRFENEAPKL